MFGSRASGAFVCLRCELQRPPSRLPSLARRTAHATFSTTARRSAAFDEEIAKSAPQPRPQRQRQTVNRNLFGWRKTRGKLRETVARLEGGVKTLGDDTAILVLKEVEERPVEENTGSDVIPATPADPVNISIVESLQLEKRPVSTSEVVQQLESMRPPTSTDPDERNYVSQATYLKLSQRLVREFTLQQLSQYYSITKGVKPKEVHQQVIEGLRELQSQVKRPQERSEWHPGTTQINLRLPGLAMPRKARRRPVSKHLLVDQILRDLWRLVLLEEIEAPGELELSLKPWQLTLLTSGGDTTPLDRIGKDRRAKIEIHWPHNVLRITADKSSAEYAANDIEDLLQKTETVRFNMQDWIPFLDPKAATSALPDIISESSRTAVGSMTGAVVLVVAADRFLIRALDKPTIGEAIRSLIKLLPLKKKTAYTIDSNVQDASKSCYLLPAVIEPEQLDFQDRHLELGRWACPVARSQELQPCIDNERLDRVQAQITTMMDSSDAPTPRSNRRRAGEHDWVPKVDQQLAARFGHALYPLESSPTSAQPGSSPIFVPAQAGLPKVLAEHDFRTVVQNGFPNLEYSFTAAPGQANFKDDQEFPQLNVQFAYNLDRDQYFLRRLSLSLDEQVHDVLLPHKAVDIRFFTRTYLRLHSPDSSKMLEGFIQAVLANISSGEKLVAPDLVIDIPNWTIPKYPHAKKPGTRAVKYLFIGTRFRQSALGLVSGNHVSISMKQSGKLGTSGIALSAHYQTSSSMKDASQQDVKDFVKNCFGIADTLSQAAASSEHLAHIVKSRKQAFWTQQSRAGAKAASAEQTAAAATPAVPLFANQSPATESPHFRQEVSTKLTHDDMHDPFAASFLFDEPPAEQLGDDAFARHESVSEEEPEDSGLKAAA